MEQNKERFLELMRSVNRDGVSDYLDWLNGTDFFVAPASTKYHGCSPGMLCEHSLSVYDELVKLVEFYEIDVPKESVILCALNHDLCKANMYRQELKNRKNEFGKWEQYYGYTIDEKFCFGGHGSKSVFLLNHFIKLTPEEGVAINCHMSSWDGAEYIGGAYEQFPFAWALHVADEAATFLREK